MKIVDIPLSSLPVVIRFKDRNIPLYASSWVNYKAYEAPEFLVLLNLQRQTDSVMFYTYWTPGVPNTVGRYCLNDQDVAILEGEEGKATLDAYKEYAKLEFPDLGYGIQPNIGSSLEFLIEDKEGFLVEPPAVFTSEVNASYYRKRLALQINASLGTCLEGHTGRVRDGLINLCYTVGNLGHRISYKSVLPVRPETLAKATPEVLDMTDDSKNVYGLKVDSFNPKELALRVASGPMHFEFGAERIARKGAEIVRAMDAIAAVACVSLFDGIDDTRRRMYAGQAGNWRNKKVGVLEYRVLSNAWAIHPLIQNIVYDFTRKAGTLGYKGYMDVWKATEQETIDCIMQNNVEKAREILANNKKVVVRILERVYNMGPGPSEGVYDIFFKGMKSCVKDLEYKHYPNWETGKTYWRHSYADVMAGYKI